MMNGGSRDDEEAIAVLHEKSYSIDVPSPQDSYSTIYSDHVPITAALRLQTAAFSVPISDDGGNDLAVGCEDDPPTPGNSTTSMSQKSSFSAMPSMICSKRRVVAMPVLLTVVGAVLAGSLLGTRLNRQKGDGASSATTAEQSPNQESSGQPPNQESSGQPPNQESSGLMPFTSTSELYTAVDAYLNATASDEDVPNQMVFLRLHQIHLQ
jgi:hypothetical protein